MRKFRILGSVLLGLLTAGCGTTSTQPEPDAVQVSDPLENMNRLFFSLNQRLDRDAARPAAQVYKDTVPQRARSSLHNVLDNLGGPVTVANDLLQAQFENAAIATGRFL